MRWINRYFYIAAICCLFHFAANADDIPVIAAASSLNFVLSEIAEDFTEETGQPVHLSFSSSGTITRQIRQGAPYELFLSADAPYVEELNAEGFTLDAGVDYALGQLVLYVADGASFAADVGLHDLVDALQEGRLQRLAIANPEHAPYGRAAKQALQQANLWEGVEAMLITGESVSHAAQFAASGSVQAALISHSLALAPKLAELGKFAIISSESYAPLVHRMALLPGAGETAKHFYQYMQQPATQSMLQNYGFSSPNSL